MCHYLSLKESDTLGLGYAPLTKLDGRGNLGTGLCAPTIP